MSTREEEIAVMAERWGAQAIDPDLPSTAEFWRHRVQFLAIEDIPWLLGELATLREALRGLLDAWEEVTFRPIPGVTIRDLPAIKARALLDSPALDSEDPR